MPLSLEDTLLTVYQQSLVENRKAVVLEDKSFPVRVTAKRKLKQVDFQFDERDLRGLEQNPETKSRWAAGRGRGDQLSGSGEEGAENPATKHRSLGYPALKWVADGGLHAKAPAPNFAQKWQAKRHYQSLVAGRCTRPPAKRLQIEAEKTGPSIAPRAYSVVAYRQCSMQPGGWRFESSRVAARVPGVLAGTGDVT
jgi:hypothetical protein